MESEEVSEKLAIKSTGHRQHLEHNSPYSAAGVGNVFFQAKLTVGSANDPLEHEADAVADRVMRMPEQSFVQRKCASCEEEDKVQRKSLTSFIQKTGIQGGFAASDAISNKINASKGGGSSMDSHTQSFMQNRFGADFSDVKIHTGGDAIQMNRDLNAKAFTVGNDIYFNEGRYSPNSDSGKHLLAHELTHTVQQSANSNLPVQRQVPPSPIVPVAALGWQIVNSILSSSGNDVQVTCDEMVGIFYRSGITEEDKRNAPSLTGNYHVFNFRVGSSVFNSDLIVLRIGMNYESNNQGIGNISFNLIETDDSSAGWEASFNFNLTPLDQMTFGVTNDWTGASSGVRLVVNYQASGWVGSTSGSVVYEVYSTGAVVLIRADGDMEHSDQRG